MTGEYRITFSESTDIVLQMNKMAIVSFSQSKITLKKVRIFIKHLVFFFALRKIFFDKARLKAVLWSWFTLPPTRIRTPYIFNMPNSYSYSKYFCHRTPIPTFMPKKTLTSQHISILWLKLVAVFFNCFYRKSFFHGERKYIFVNVISFSMQERSFNLIRNFRF